MCFRRFAPLLCAAVGCRPAAVNGPPDEPPVPAVEIRTVAPVAAPAPAAPEPAVVAAVRLGGEGGWSLFHGDAAHTGAVAVPAIRQPRIRWKAQVGSQSWLNSPLVTAELVIVPSCGRAHNRPDPGDGVYALSLETGRRLWQAPLSSDANGAGAGGDRVFVTSDDGYLYALDLATGRQLWKRPGQGKMYTHPLLAGDRVVVGDGGGYVRAFTQADGAPAWQLRLTGAIRGGAAADEQAVYVASEGGEVAAIGHDGTVRWQQIVARPPFGGSGPSVPIEVYSPPVLTAELLILPFARDTTYEDAPALIALDKQSGTIRWRASGAGSWGNIRSTPALVLGTLVYSEPYSGDVVGVDVLTGRLRFRRTVGPCYFPQWASPAAAGDLVYVPRFDGAIYAVRAGSGEVAWEIYLGDSRRAGSAPPKDPPSRYGCEWQVGSGYSCYSPAAIAADGTLLTGTAEGFLYAIDDAAR